MPSKGARVHQAVLVGEGRLRSPEGRSTRAAQPKRRGRDRNVPRRRGTGRARLGPVHVALMGGPGDGEHTGPDSTRSARRCGRSGRNRKRWTGGGRSSTRPTLAPPSKAGTAPGGLGSLRARTGRDRRPTGTGCEGRGGTRRESARCSGPGTPPRPAQLRRSDATPLVAEMAWLGESMVVMVSSSFSEKIPANLHPSPGCR